MDLTTRVNLVKNHSKNKECNLTVSVVAKLAGINRTSIYYKGTPVSDEELECKRSIDRPNQAWSIDITYIPMKHGFLYLTAIIDWHSRCIVGWELDDTLDTRACIEACEKAFKVAKPEILNSDQGCQFTSQKYKDFLKANKIKQSMDGKSRWADNIMIERWFRTFKYEEAYLTEWKNIKEARQAIAAYIHKYNFEGCHSAIGNVPPASVYYPAMLYEAAKEAA